VGQNVMYVAVERKSDISAFEAYYRSSDS
jgi:hypothetical protein